MTNDPQRLSMAIRAEVEGRRALTEQLSSLDALRQRAVWTLSAAGLVGTLAMSHLSFGDLHGGGRFVLVLGLVGAGIVAVAAVAAQWPRDFDLSFDAETLVRDYVDVESQSELSMCRDLAIFLQHQHLSNGPRLGPVRWAAAAGLCGLGIEVLGLLWAVSLAPS